MTPIVTDPPFLGVPVPEFVTTPGTMPLGALVVAVVAVVLLLACEVVVLELPHPARSPMPAIAADPWTNLRRVRLPSGWSSMLLTSHLS
jgi:hypothetical protein